MFLSASQIPMFLIFLQPVLSVAGRIILVEMSHPGSMSRRRRSFNADSALSCLGTRISDGSAL
jgi:hypothetical protein